MELLKKENWWIWLIVTLFSGSTGAIVLGALLGCFDKKAWYAKPMNWVFGFCCFFFPAAIMACVFMIQMLCQASAKLEVPGKELYLSPYVWILFIIIPIIGWIFIPVTLLYLTIWHLVMLAKGNGEKYINN